MVINSISTFAAVVNIARILNTIIILDAVKRSDDRTKTNHFSNLKLKTIMSKTISDQLTEAIKTGQVKVETDGTVVMNSGYRDGDDATANKRGLDPNAKRYPYHFAKIGLLFRNNRDLARLTSLALLKYLNERGDISGDKQYVMFRYNKFTVKYRNLNRDYSYLEGFFFDALNAAIKVLSENITNAANELARKELSKTFNSVCDEESTETFYEYLTKKSKECAEMDAKDFLVK